MKQQAGSIRIGWVIEYKGKPWTDIEDDKLRDEFKSKIKLSDIAAEHGRTRGAIESRLDHLGLQKKSFKFWLMKKAK